MIGLSDLVAYLKKHRRFRIVFGGDSITSAEWVHPNWREMVEYALKEEAQKIFRPNYQLPSWGIRGINCGFDGATTRDIVNKIPEILKYEPDLVIMMIGGNDGVLGIDLEEHKNNLKEINERMGDVDYFVYLTDICPDNGRSASKYLPYVEADRKFDFGKTQFINLYQISKSFDSQKIFTFKSEAIPEENIKEGDRDFWHPNQLGNACIAKVVLGEVFGVNFDPEKYIKETLAGEKYPGY